MNAATESGDNAAIPHQSRVSTTVSNPAPVIARAGDYSGCPRRIARDPVGFLSDLYHGVMVFFCSVGLMIDRTLRIGDTYFTYKYCQHLDQMTYFKDLFRQYLSRDPCRVDQWKRRQLWVDEMPRMDRLRDLPEGSLGRSFYEATDALEKAGLPNLRPKRLKALPEEIRALDLNVVSQESDPDRLFGLLVARRNIYMTSSHDFFHFLSGSNTKIAGEALVARYQFRHLLCPQNLMNMRNSLLCHFCIGRFDAMRIIRNLFPEIDKTIDFTTYDWESAWARPLDDVRRELGLPVEGFMPDGVVPGLDW